MKIRHITFSAAFLGTALASWAAAPSGYYNSCEGQSGKNLLSQLCSVVGPHTNIGYDALWDLYKSSDVDENGRIWDMYSTKRWSTGEKCGSYSAVGSCYNREHSLPKSWFKEASPMKSDAFHIYPTDGKVNGQRSNYPFGECANGTTLSAPSGIKALGKLGTSTFPGYSGKVFEPDDEYKGDFARSYFYMAAAYNDKISGWNSDMLAKNSYPVFTSWATDLLLKWHRQDPVSKKELDRNEAVYARQRNRNPFIDHPELVEYIWGDKQSERWYANGAPDPAITLPVQNSTVDFGTTAINYQVSRAVKVTGANLTSPVTATVSDSRFTLSAASVAAASVNAGTASLTVTFKSSTAGTAKATLTLKSGSLTRTVNLSATTVDGIPAYPATHVTAESFTAGWMDLGDYDDYSLNVLKNGASIDGYPVSVTAALEEWTVEDLEPETTYTYQLSSPTLKSNVVAVTTGQLIPSVQILTDGEMEISATPGEPSQPLELWLDIENIDSELTLAVEAPFQLSTDHINWARQIELQPLEDRFYLRVEATQQGEYETAITVTAGDYINDDTDVTAFVADNSTPWFIETFEGLTSNGYSTATVKGTACDWNVKDVGFYSDGNGTEGVSARLGKTSASELATATAKRSGIGSVSFDGCRWSSSDGDVTLAIEYSSDGSEWKSAGTVTLDSDQCKSHSVVVNALGDNYLRIRQTAGKRGNIDNITVSDYTAGVDEIEFVDSWDAYCVNGELAIDNQGDSERVFTVYNLEGMTLVSRQLSRGVTSIRLTPGLYLVSSDSLVRRVIVH